MRFRDHEALAFSLDCSPLRRWARRSICYEAVELNALASPPTRPVEPARRIQAAISRERFSGRLNA